MNDFVPSKSDTGFRKLSKYGLTNLHQLHNAGNLKSFSQLSEEFKLPRTDFFRYLQLRDFLFKHKDWDKVAKPMLIEELLI